MATGVMSQARLFPPKTYNISESQYQKLNNNIFVAAQTVDSKTPPTNLIYINSVAQQYVILKNSIVHTKMVKSFQEKCEILRNLHCSSRAICASTT